ncbi:MAG: glycoside hydrolase family 15 protein [Chloroflexi bacterium]|nr:glycoside hydrolase family 15 protein [Chloroflexota bacterium]
MTRVLPVGNGDMMVNFDLSYDLRDIHYPHTGGENHGSISRFGVFVDHMFSWLSGPAWRKRLNYEPYTLVTSVEAENPGLELRVLSQDIVDVGRPIYLKKVTFTNMASVRREIKAFFHCNLNISGHAVGNSIYYDPSLRCLIQYKGKRYFLLNACTGGKVGLHDFATGVKGRNGLEGTYRDAEDGQLGRNPAAHGGVDGVGSLTLGLPPSGEVITYWWIAAGQNYREVVELDRLIASRTPESFIERTRAYWKTWANRNHDDFGDLDERLVELYWRSLLVLRTHSDNRGGILAANDSDMTAYNDDNYSYVWPRDGALAAIALSKAGFHAQAKKFFIFCSEAIAQEGFLFHRYNPDGSLGSSWHTWTDSEGKYLLPIQEDETALALVALWNHYRNSQDMDLVQTLYSSLVKPAADFLVRYREPNTGLPEASYDLWEERRAISTYTVSTVWAGLRAASGLAQALGDCSAGAVYSEAAEQIKAATLQHLYSPKLGRFVRMVQVDKRGRVCADPTMDSSLFGLFYFDMFEPRAPNVMQTMRDVEERLWCPDCGGVARYEGDPYLRVRHDSSAPPGNPWIICTLWLAQWHIAKAESVPDLGRAKELLGLVCQRALPGGILPEQVNPVDLSPLSASPLTWSHATYILTVQEYVSKYKALANGMSTSQNHYFAQELSCV